MFTIQGTHIRMTRGDTASFTVDILCKTEEAQSFSYTMAAGDTLLFTAKQCLADKKPVLQLQAVGTPEFHLKPEHTKHMLGRYVYDVELHTAAGDVYTVLGPGDFPSPELDILAEVTE